MQTVGRKAQVGSSVFWLSEYWLNEWLENRAVLGPEVSLPGPVQVAGNPKWSLRQWERMVIGGQPRTHQQALSKGRAPLLGYRAGSSTKPL